MHTGFGQLAAEVSESRTVTNAIAKHMRIPLPTPRPPPPPFPPPPLVPSIRAPMDSYNDLDEEITLNGHRILKGTEEQVAAVIDRKVREALHQAALEASDATVKAAKRGASKVLTGIAVAMAAAVGGGFIHFFEKLNH